MNAIFELEIGPRETDGTYVVRVLRSAGGGQPTGSFTLDVDELLSRRPLYEATVLSSAVAARRVMSNTEATVQQVGLLLFTSVFADAIGSAYRTSSAVAQERGTSLQLVLRLTPELAALPWESLYDPETGSYVCRQETLVRNVSAAYTAEPLAIEPPLRILGIVASPRDLQRLDTAVERARLEQALRPQLDAGLVELVWLDDVSWPGLHAKLLDQSWHVLHFVGHGGFDAATDEGHIALEAEDGRADFVSASSLADLLHEAEPTPRLVVLNSCMSGAVSEDDLFSGTAAALVRSGITAVAAMQFAISDGAAISFARGFYTALARGRGVDEAVRSGRIGILGMGRGTLEWVTPVLYLRGGATSLFDIAPLAPAPIGPAAPVDTASDPATPDPATTPAPPEVAPIGVGRLAPVDAPPAPPEDVPITPEEAQVPSEEAPVDDSNGGDHRGEPPQGPSVPPARRRLAPTLSVALAAVALVGAVAWGVAALGGLVTPGPTDGPVDPTPQTAELAVPANATWTGTGLECTPGADLAVTARSSVLDASTGLGVPPDGLADPSYRERNLDSLPDMNGGALIGSIGGGEPFFLVGSAFQGVCPTAGELMLGPNDRDPSGDAGSFQVSVTVTPNPTVPAAQVLTIPADATWTSTGIACSAGEPVRFLASGAVQHGLTPDRRSGPDGTSDYDADWNVAGLESQNHASLIGSVAGALPFVIGSDAQMECPADGELLLGINDDGSDIALNEGAFTVAVLMPPES